MIWRNPLAWLGLGTLLVPIAIHLLVRQHARPVAFPSLRFLQSSRLAAVRRRALRDWPLLAVRMLILALAVAALADPFVSSVGRRSAWAGRVTRAILIDRSPSVDAQAAAAAAAREQASAYDAIVVNAAAAGGAVGTAIPESKDHTGADARPAASASLAARAGADAGGSTNTADMRAAIASGLGWLQTAAPSAREIVIISDFQRGALTSSLFDPLPPHVGLRFVRVGQRSAGAAGGPVNGRPVDGRTVEGRPSSARTLAGLVSQTPTVTVLPGRTDVGWRITDGARPFGPAATAPALPATRGDAGRQGGAKSGAADQTRADRAASATAATDVDERALGLRLRTTEDERPAARAALDAVLSAGVPLAGGMKRPVVLVVGEEARTLVGAGAAAADRPAARGADGSGDAGVSRAGSPEGPRSHPSMTPAMDATRLQPLAAPWMAEALAAVARDGALADAVAATDGAATHAAGAAAAGGVGLARGTSLPDESSLPNDSRLLTVVRGADGRSMVSAASIRVADLSDVGKAIVGVQTPTRASESDGGGEGGEGGNASASSGASALVVLSALPAASEATPLLIRAVLRATADPDPLPEAEVASVDDATLDGWRRPAALPPAAELPRVETGDRRWFWAAALALILFETWLRRRQRQREPETREVPDAA